MPHGYEVMRDSFKKKGLSDKAAKKKAAMIWNAKHKGNPVTRAKHEAFCDFMENRWDKSPQTDIPSLHSRMKGRDTAPREYPPKVKSSTDGLGNPIPVKKVPHLSVRKYLKFAEIPEDNETMGVGMITPESEKTVKDKSSAKPPKKPNYPMRTQEEVGNRVGIAGGNANEQGLSGAATSSKDLKLRDFKVKQSKVPKTLGREAAEIQKAIRARHLRTTGAVFGEAIAPGPDKKHNDVFNALANLAATKQDDDGTGAGAGAEMYNARARNAHEVLAKAKAAKEKKTESFCSFMEAYLDNDSKRSIFNTIKSIKTSRAMDMKRGKTPSDIETGFSRELRANADKYRSGAKPWDPKDKEIESHFHKLANGRTDLADKLKVQGK